MTDEQRVAAKEALDVLEHDLLRSSQTLVAILGESFPKKFAAAVMTLRALVDSLDAPDPEPVAAPKTKRSIRPEAA